MSYDPPPAQRSDWFAENFEGDAPLSGALPLSVDDCRRVVSSFFWLANTQHADTGCILWLGSKTKLDGYGRVPVGRRMFVAHRVYWVAANGRDVPDGAVLDHLCRVRECVNPRHLEPVSPRVNTLRGNTIPAAMSARTHCQRGHELVPRGDRKTRGCIACNRERSASTSRNLIAAARSLEMLRDEYVRAFGSSKNTARAVVLMRTTGIPSSQISRSTVEEWLANE